MNQPKHKNIRPVNRRVKKDQAVVAAFIGVLVVAVIILLLLRGCGAEGTAAKPDDTSDTPSGSTGIVYDSNAVEGGWDEADTEKIVESLSEKVDAGMINISMNTSPVFADGEAAGNLMIVNEGINRYPQIVEITRNDTGEVVYKSGAIPVGSKIEEAKLTVDLPAGAYECTAMFTSIDPDTGASLGCAGAVIHITILE